MVRRKTHEEFVAEVNALVGDEYTVVGTYVKRNDVVTIKHNTCGSEYNIRPGHFLSGRRCRYCATRRRMKSQDEFVKEVKSSVGDEYRVLGPYNGDKVKVKVKHLSCRRTYEVIAGNIIKGKRCPHCYLNKLKTTVQFEKELFDIHGEDYAILGKYRGASTKIYIRHNHCGKIYKTTPSIILKGCGCPNCKTSKGEKRIEEWLESRKINFTSQKLVRYDPDKAPLRLDFYVCGVAIEYDGELHYKAKEFFGGEDGLIDTQRRDAIKTQYCVDNGIPLIRIPYWDFDNIDAILTEKLLPLLKVDASLTQKNAS